MSILSSELLSPEPQALRAVYLRVTDTDQGLDFNDAEHAICDGQDSLPSPHSVQAIRHRRLLLETPIGEGSGIAPGAVRTIA